MRATIRWVIGTMAIGAAVVSSGCSNSQHDAAPTPSSAPAQANTASAAATAPVEATAAASGPCVSSHVRAALGKASTVTGDQHTQPVTLTNTSSAPCTLAGFPEVALVGTAQNADGTTGTSPNYRWPLQHTNAGATAITLAPNGTANVEVTYLADAGGDPVLNVSAIELTLPGDATHIQVTWSAAVMLQDAATHSGTYSGPFVSGH